MLWTKLREPFVLEGAETSQKEHPEAFGKKYVLWYRTSLKKSPINIFSMVEQRYLYMREDWLHDTNALIAFIHSAVSRRESKMMLLFNRNNVEYQKACCLL